MSTSGLWPWIRPRLYLTLFLASKCVHTYTTSLQLDFADSRLQADVPYPTTAFLQIRNQKFRTIIVDKPDDICKNIACFKQERRLYSHTEMQVKIVVLRVT